MLPSKSGPPQGSTFRENTLGPAGPQVFKFSRQQKYVFRWKAWKVGHQWKKKNWLQGSKLKKFPSRLKKSRSPNAKI